MKTLILCTCGYRLWAITPVVGTFVIACPKCGQLFQVKWGKDDAD